MSNQHREISLKSLKEHLDQAMLDLSSARLIIKQYLPEHKQAATEALDKTYYVYMRVRNTEPQPPEGPKAA